MAGYGFKDRKVAERLRSIGEKSLLTNPSEQSSPKVNYPITENELILIAPVQGIPAASGNTHYSAICCLYDCEENLQTNVAVASLSDTCKYIRCYNDLTDAIAPYTVFVGKLRKYGMFYVSKILYIDRTTTTTVIQDADGLVCAGTCKWVWSASTQEWVKTVDTCSASTTTTTTDPLTTTTTTTTPCPCEEGIDPEELYLQTSSTTTTTTTTVFDPTSTTTTTTTSTTTSTTTTPACNCEQPEFCGTASGQCVYTNCIPSYFENLPPDCTTSSTTTTTTSSCDCATTTTVAGCSQGCDWYCGPTGSWLKSTDGCASTCPCPAPDYACTNNPCGTTHTNCVNTSTTTTEPRCTGECSWWWHSFLQQWILNGVTCNWNTALTVIGGFCGCPKPTGSGGVCGDEATTNCMAYYVTSSTTTTTTTTPGPCWQCYTSSTSSTTTTTNACADGKCTWIYSVGAWVLSSNTCPSNCPCPTPPGTPTDPCQITWTLCVGSTTTTTTTTTTSTTTSTTTTCPAVGGCMFHCGPSGWVAVCDCPTPEVCDPCYTNPCMVADYGTLMVCTCGTTTTTTTTSTTTTTTTTCNPATICTGIVAPLCGCSWVFCQGSWILCDSGCGQPVNCPDTECPDLATVGCTPTPLEGERCSSGIHTCVTTSTTTTTTTTDTGACCYNYGTCNDGITNLSCVSVYLGVYLGNGTTCGAGSCDAYTTT